MVVHYSTVYTCVLSNCSCIRTGILREEGDLDGHKERIELNKISSGGGNHVLINIELSMMCNVMSNGMWQRVIEEGG